MNCYNHRNVPAVATCKNCSKGLCPDCLTEIENGIACKATCIDEVIAINTMIQNNKKARSTVSSSYNRAMFVYIGMGILFLYTGFLYDGLRFYMLSAGALFLILGVWTYFSIRKLKAEQK